jgi:hypothetical protein
MEFEECLWEEPGGPPDAETISDPGFRLLVVCVQCATILCLIVSTGELRVLNAAQIEQCPPDVLLAVRERQRQAYVLRARQIARKN